MNPLLKEVIRLWNISEPEVPFHNLVNDCMWNGAVIIKPGFILIAKELHTDGRKIEDKDPKNCWYIFAASQHDLSLFHFMKEAIWKRDYVAFARRGKIHIYKWKDLENKLRG